jgi:hypothetical protein
VRPCGWYDCENDCHPVDVLPDRQHPGSVCRRHATCVLVGTMLKHSHKSATPRPRGHVADTTPLTSDALAVPRLTSRVSGAAGSNAPPLASYESLRGTRGTG